MFRLTREVRFALIPGGSAHDRNGHAGVPALDRIAPWGALAVTVQGELDPASGYLLNIKDIDHAVRSRAIPALTREPASMLERLPAMFAGRLSDAWPRVRLLEVRYCLSPFFSIGCVVSELPMIRINQKFEFSASHRLNNERLSESENRKLFGKCNNPHGHGHNYEVQVSLFGEPDSSGVLLRSGELERIVQERVIDEFDHKYLNLEVPEFARLNPSVENIAMVIFRRLKPAFAGSTKLASVTVWETPRTSSEYSEQDRRED